LTVILFGAGLSAILVYALATELFAKNSPTVLYGDACDKIRESSSVCVSLSTNFNLVLSYVRISLD
jgi:mitochondrial import inner membrane translocase subunit TIM21